MGGGGVAGRRLLGVGVGELAERGNSLSEALDAMVGQT